MARPRAAPTVEVVIPPEAVAALAARHRYAEQVSVFDDREGHEAGVQALVPNPESREEFARRMLEEHLDAVVAEHDAQLAAARAGGSDRG